ncbi:DUF3349 domain-containing protein [Tsukamurella soli]|uniref:DUF3349 domain-containing protein n=1 Tax=Tsukamurella soli TaxID=644556 RepID=A0ABP8JTS6_9ACTN
MSRSDKPVLSQVLGWLRASYPDGIPPKDYFPLLALLERTLTDEEQNQVIGHLLAARPEGSVDRQQIEEAIAKVTHAEPGTDDTRRIAARLAAGGWPLTGFTT